VFLGKLPDGVAGIKATLDLMVKLSQAGRKSWPVRSLAESLVRDLPQKSWIEEARAIQHFVRDQIRYTMDVRGTETVATPDQTLARGVGDCDDKSLLASALLESIGHPTRFVAIGKTPGNFVHVLVETRVANRWIPVETTEPVELGWYPAGYPYRLVRNV
jgi:transglutaminase-like putative cysteine protease